MSLIPADLRYTEEHEYVMATDEPGVYTIGVTDYAQSELGDVVYVELPDVGDRLSRMEVFGTVEAVKAVSDLYCPISGEVVGANAALADDPGLVNSDAYGAGWMIRVRIDSEDELQTLMRAEEYATHIGED